MLSGQDQPGDDEASNGDDLHHHQQALCASADFYPETVDEREYTECHCRNYPIIRRHTCEFDKVSREGDRYSCYASSLNDQQQYPSIQKSDRRMVALAQVRVLTAD